MKWKRATKGTKRKAGAVVPRMIFGLGAALTPVIPGCGVGSAGDNRPDLSVRRIDLGVMIPRGDFSIGVMVNPDFSIEDRPNFDVGVMAPRDFQFPDMAPGPDLGVDGGGDDGTGGDR